MVGRADGQHKAPLDISSASKPISLSLREVALPGMPWRGPGFTLVYALRHRPSHQRASWTYDTPPSPVSPDGGPVVRRHGTSCVAACRGCPGGEP